MEQAQRMAAAGAEPDPKRDHLRLRGSAELTEKDKRLFLFEGGEGKFSFAVCARTGVWVTLGLAIAGNLPWTKPFIAAVLTFFGLNP